MDNVITDINFSSLEKLANRLNNASDSATLSLQRIEERLIQLNIGIEVWCSEPIFTSDTSGSIGPQETIKHNCEYIGFARVDKKWCLAVKSIRIVDGYFEGDMDCPYRNCFMDDPIEPLLQQSRSKRIAALKSMPMFISELSRAIENTLTDLDAAEKAVQSKIM